MSKGRWKPGSQNEKLITMHRCLHPGDNNERLNIRRKEKENVLRSRITSTMKQVYIYIYIYITLSLKLTSLEGKANP